MNFKVTYMFKNRWTSKVINAKDEDEVYDILKDFLRSDEFEIYSIEKV
jgi:hypothetical protein